MTDSLRLAVSNIAWEPADDDAVAAVLRSEGVSAIEIAPTKWRKWPIETNAIERREYRRAWADRGMQIVSMQSLLFGRPDLQLFGPTRPALSDYIRGLMDMGADLGVRTFIFGSPKNRVRGDLPIADAMQIAADFFRLIGKHAAQRNTVVCIEANPPAYGCDFITTTAEAVALCTAVNHPGIAINVDLGGMTMSGEPPRETIVSASGMIGHFHASEPQLAELGAQADHAAAARGLAEIDYDKWISIEMREGDVKAAVRLAKACYVIPSAARDLGPSD
jgi:D-psicose/D-tagatose/L-ribulose 3-epimerase